MKRSSAAVAPRKRSKGCLIVVGILIVLVALGAASSAGKSPTSGPAPVSPTVNMIVITPKPTTVNAAPTVAPTAIPAAAVKKSPASASTTAPQPTSEPVQAAPASGYVCEGEPCIKGNINDKGVKLYHLPVGCPSYNQTKIDRGAGEQMFASEADALAAGWTKSPNCK